LSSRPASPATDAVGARHLLFVYGTLLAAEKNHSLLAKSEFAGSAFTVAAFDLFDWGEYPAMAPGGCTRVAGELYWVTRAELEVLDDFEGHPSLFRRSLIALSDDRSAHAYLAARARSTAPAIPHGDWRRWRAERLQ
jgi:gamma-glutamylcyclotransferase (GGCT)/AIG2-like uncharacterized protein YtfP